MKSRELGPAARALRKQGLSYMAIADKLGINEKTVRRWLSSPDDSEQPAGEPQAAPSRPEDETWPGWTLGDLADLPGFDREAWKDNLDVIDMANTHGNAYVPWFFRRLVDVLRLDTVAGIVVEWSIAIAGRNAFGGSQRAVNDTSLEWAIAIAGLPVLGSWLGSSGDFERLTRVIEQTHPWQGRRARQAYSRDAKDPEQSVRAALLLAGAMWTMHRFSIQGVAGAPLAPGLFVALHERTPYFDQAPRLSRYRGWPLGSIILGILTLPRGG